MSSENQCTGCGATVTNQSHGIFRDVSGSQYCQRKTSEEALRFHSIELPPVAINPDHGSALDENNVCPTCFREYGEDEIKFCTADDCPSHPDYRVAIKPEAALTPLEKELISAINDASSCLTSRNGCDPQAALKIMGAALFIAEDRASKQEVAPQVWFRETETLNFLYIARPDGRFWVVAMETERGDIYAIENSPARNPSAKPMAVQA